MMLIDFSKEQQSAIDKFVKMGGVIDFKLAIRKSELNEFDSHRNACILAIKEIQARSKIFKITFDDSKLIGSKVTYDKFMGKLFDLENNKLLIMGKSPQFLNEYFVNNEIEITENIVKPPVFGWDLAQGFSYAFLEPPYNLQGTHKEIYEIFHEISNLLFSGFKESAEIWSWSEECSNYFDAGKEFWGTFFYTYSIKGSQNIIIVLASATD